MRPFHSLFFIFALLSFQQTAAQYGYIFSGTDTDGNNHDIQEYLDAGKPVLIYDFTAYDGTMWLLHEDGVAIDLYNSMGQGGSNEIVVLYIAGFGFDNAADITSIDYTMSLGAGYDDLDLTENNPVPIVLAADNPGLETYSKGGRLWLCPQNGSAYLSPSSMETEAVLAQLFDVCCTVLEDERVSLSWTSATMFDPSCDPSVLGYQITNETAIDMSGVAVDVFVNDDFLETVLYDELLEGCASVVLEYNNAAIGEGDEVTMAIGQPNADLYTDTITTVRDVVYPTGTTIKLEILEPAEPGSDLSYHCSDDGGSGVVNAGVNWINYLFLSPGCYRLSLNPGEGTIDTDLIMIGSTDENDQYTDTVYYGDMNGMAQFYLEFTLQVEGESADQKVWGYVFEDVDEGGGFQPDLPRISGIQANYGTLTTFTDTDGYYEFPQFIPFENVNLVYDENTWPVMTTPNAGNVNIDNYIHNFGLNSDDPIWLLTSNLDMGLPYICESGISNTVGVFNSGNQPTEGELVFVYDPILTAVDFYPAPASVNGNEITFAIPEVAYGYSAGFTIIYEDISADLLGEPMTANYSLTTFDDQGNAVNTDTGNLADTLYCAFDPNDKYGFPRGEGVEGFIEPNTPLKYRIRFQNTGNLPATTVVIRDTLPETLNWESFEPLTASHAHSIIMDGETREVVWTFNQIMLPDSASDPEGSIGSLWFDIEMNDLTPGAQIENTAYIYFDQNEPIVTNTSLHTISDLLSSHDAEEASFSVFPNPARSAFFIEGTFAEADRLRITDLYGRVVREQTLPQTAIDISGLSSGLYLVSVGTGKAVKLMVVKD